MLTKEKDGPAFAEIIASLKALPLHLNTPITRHTIDLYFAALEEYDINDIRLAVSRHIKHPEAGRFFPAPADLIKIMQGGTASRAALAWAKVERAIREIGPWEDVVFDDPTIHLVIHELGGWGRLCEIKEADLNIKSRTFQNIYPELAARQPAERAIPALKGIAARPLNSAPRCALVGDHAGALAVLRTVSVAAPVYQLASVTPS